LIFDMEFGVNIRKRGDKLSVSPSTSQSSSPATSKRKSLLFLGGSSSSATAASAGALSASGTGFEFGMSKCNRLFQVLVKPSLTKHVADLWRMNTASRYVRGEEVLHPWWVPRGVSLVKDFHRFVGSLRWEEQVEATRQMLMSSGGMESGEDNESAES